MRKLFIALVSVAVLGAALWGGWLWYMRTGDWGLPVGSVVEVPAAKPTSSDLVLILSGDGGWADLDKQLGKYLSDAGVSVLGFDVMKYFWEKRTPDDMSRDIVKILRIYKERWKKDRLVLIGYSFGADVMASLVNRLPDDIRRSVDLVVLLGPALYANWEVRINDWMTDVPHEDATETLPEARRMAGVPILCVYGEEEAEKSLCPRLPDGIAEILKKPGGHHFDENYETLTNVILHRLSKR